MDCFSELTDRWSAKCSAAAKRRYRYRFGSSEATAFSELMAETYGCLKEEWKKETISKECCRMLMAFSKYGVEAWADEDGNCDGNELFEAASWIHYGLRKSIEEDGKLPDTDEDGNLILKHIAGWKTYPAAFSVPENPGSFLDFVFG